MAWYCDVPELFTGPRLPLLPRRTPLLPPRLRPESKQYNTIHCNAMQSNFIAKCQSYRTRIDTRRANHKTTSYIIITTANIGVKQSLYT